MKALLRKELRELAPFLLLVPLLALVEVLLHGPGERFVAPSLVGQRDTVLLLPVVAAALMGCSELPREARAGTLGYLLHREIAPSRLVAAKALAGALVSVPIALAAPAAGYAATRLASPLSALVEPARLLEMASLAAAVPLAQGVGFFAGSLRGPRAVLWLLALAGVLLVILAAYQAQVADALPPALELLLFPLACAGAWAACVALACAAPLALDARERSLPSAAAACRAAGALALCVPPAWILAGFLVLAFAEGARDEVFVVPDAEGGFQMVRELRRPPLDYPVDRLTIATASAPGASLEEERGGLGARWSRWFGRLDHERDGGMAAWLDRDAGVARVFALRGGADGGPRAWRVEAPDGPLERDARIVPPIPVQGSRPHASALMLEPASRHLWALRTTGEPRLERVVLPGGDSLLGFEIAVRDSFAGTKTLALRGERGVYVWRGDELEPRWAGVIPASEFLRAGPPRVLLADPDPLRPRIDVVTGAGEVLLTHRDGPSGARGAIAAAASGAASLVLSPAVSVVAHVRSAEVDPWRLGLTNPLVAVGRRRALVCLHVAVALAFALAALFRQSKGARPPARALSWAGAIALLGPAGALALLAVEPPARPRAARPRAARRILVGEARP